MEIKITPNDKSTPSGKLADQVLQLSAETQDAEDNLGGKPRVTRIQVGAVLKQQIRRIPARFDALQYIKSDNARRSHCPATRMCAQGLS